MKKARVHVPDAVLELIRLSIKNDHKLKLYRPVVVAIVENATAEILLVQSTKGKIWGFPQGGVNPHENVIDGLRRELLEETGVVVSEVRSFCHIDQLDTPGRKRAGFKRGKHYYYFHVVCKGWPEVILQKEEVRAYRWLPRTLAAALIRRLKNKYREKRSSMLKALKNVTVTY